MKRYGFPVFFRLLRRTLFESRGTFARMTPRRALTMAVFVPGLFFGQIIHRIAFVLDDLFFPGWRDVPIERPVFMVGIPRSGTTHLHRLVSKDAERFTTLTTWEMVLAPSIIERKVLIGLGKLDAALGGYARKAIKALEDRAFAPVRKIHKIGLWEPEEDDIALFPIFASVFLIFAFPFPQDLDDLVRFDVKMPPEDKKAIMDFYRDCVKRHLYVHGTDKRFLSKNPAFSSKIDALIETFPDCHIICNVRSPYDAVPSLISFLSFSWSRFDNDKRGDEFNQLILDLVGHWYRHPADRMEKLGTGPDGRHAFVKYDDLTRDPQSVLEDLYRRIGLQFGPRFQEMLDKEMSKAKSYKSQHEYDLADFGLSVERIEREFGDIFEHFGFPMDRGEQKDSTH